MAQCITFLNINNAMVDWLAATCRWSNMAFERVTLNQSQNVYPITNHKANIRSNQ